jgi:hypothetical protein
MPAAPTEIDGITAAAKVNVAIPVRVFEGMSASSAMIFRRRLWKIFAMSRYTTARLNTTSS